MSGVNMVLKSSEKELERKRSYYKANKEKILEKKHARNAEIYVNKRMREMSSEEEFSKEQLRKLTKLESMKPDSCEMCNQFEIELDHKLEAHHLNYDDEEKSVGEIVWVCKQCHSELDRVRRRQ